MNFHEIFFALPLENFSHELARKYLIVVFSIPLCNALLRHLHVCPAFPPYRARSAMRRKNAPLVVITATTAADVVVDVSVYRLGWRARRWWASFQLSLSYDVILNVSVDCCVVQVPDRRPPTIHPCRIPSSSGAEEAPAVMTEEVPRRSQRLSLIHI